MILLALDPGEKTSGVVWLKTGVDRAEIHGAHGAVDNLVICDLFNKDVDEIVCERVVSQGKRVGNETLATRGWYGRFQQAAHERNIPFHGLTRTAVCLHLYRYCTRPMPATPDARIRKALGVRFSREELKGVKGHAMAALALGVTFIDKYPAVRTVSADEWDVHLDRGANNFEKTFRGK